MYRVHNQRQQRGILNYKLIQIGIVLSTLSSIYLFLKKYEIKKFVIFLDYFSILILNYYLSPLVAFTIYFCFLHSIRHIISLSHELNKTNIKKGLNIFFNKAFCSFIAFCKSYKLLNGGLAHSN